jgi:hypothetical protein
LADGRVATQERVLIRKLRLGSYEISNVTATIGPTNSPLQAGQSLLSRLNYWSIDNSKGALMIGGPDQNAQLDHPKSDGWVKIGSAPEGTYYLNVDSVEVSGMVRGFWTKWAKSGGMQHVAKYSVQCGTNEAVKVCYTNYTANGSELDTGCPTRILSIPQNSFLEQTGAFVCEMTTSGKRVRASAR